MVDYTEISPSNMTADDAPSPYVASMDSQITTYAPWYGFDGSNTDWAGSASAAFPHWLKIDLGSANAAAATKHEIINGLTGSSDIKDFTFEGSNNDSDWDELDSVTGQANSTGTFSYEFSNTTSYRYYRWNVSASWGATFARYDEGNIYKTTAAAGTNTQINIGDTWKAIASAKINIADSWKDAAGMQINVGDTWKTIF